MIFLDQGVVLTTDTDQFIIGQRVYVGGHRPGQIAFIGETHFAPGDWAGIVLDSASGKNDGCVSGKRYFQCEPKRGIFSRLTRLTMEPLGDAGYSPTNSMNVSIRSIISPPRSGTVSPTRSVSSYVGKSPASNWNFENRSKKQRSTLIDFYSTDLFVETNLSVGDRVIVSSGMGSRAGILQYLGETKFAPGNWCGVQLDEPSGKNDGTVDGVQYVNSTTPLYWLSIHKYNWWIFFSCSLDISHAHRIMEYLFHWPRSHCHRCRKKRAYLVPVQKNRLHRSVQWVALSRQTHLACVWAHRYRSQQHINFERPQKRNRMKKIFQNIQSEIQRIFIEMVFNASCSSLGFYIFAHCFLFSF